MSTLLIRLIGPMQSWGGKSAFEQRGTLPEPSKSGVIGLLCAALGRDRSEPLDDLCALKMGVRIDSAGELQFDFQTALNVAKADGGKGDTQLSKRAYLSDAAFWVALEGDKALLSQLQQALLNPVWPLFLGRKSYLPSYPIVDSENALIEADLQTALQQAPRIQFSEATSSQEQSPYRKCVVETDELEFSEQRQDVPLSFEVEKRSFSFRLVLNTWLEVTAKEVLYV